MAVACVSTQVGAGVRANLDEVGRNLYILAATLLAFSLVSYGLGLTGLGHEPGAPSDAGLWQMIGIVLLLLALVVALLGVLQTMFEQADRRAKRNRAREAEGGPRGGARGDLPRGPAR